MDINGFYKRFTHVIGVFICLFFLFGCEGSGTKEKVSDTVDEFSGKKTIEQGNQMKKQLEEINTLQKQRNDELNK